MHAASIRLIFFLDGLSDNQEDQDLLAKHGEVGLANDEGEDEVDADSDGLSGASCLNVVELRGDQPSQGTPGPGKASGEEALKSQNCTCRILGNVPSCLVEASAHDSSHHHKADEHLNASLDQEDFATKPADTEINREGRHFKHTVARQNR